MSQAEALPSLLFSPPLSTVLEDAFAPPLMLIQVPRVASPAPRQARAAASASFRAVRRPLRSGRRRRRLRPRVRIAGLTLLALLPLGLAWPLLNGGRLLRSSSLHLLALPSPAVASRPEGASRDRDRWSATERAARTHRVWLTVEPAAVSAEGEADVPVVLPGYLLPDDSREEPAHEGS